MNLVLLHSDCYVELQNLSMRLNQLLAMIHKVQRHYYKEIKYELNFVKLS